MLSVKLVYATLNLLAGFMVLSEMSSQVCDKLSERPWQKYDTSSVPKIPGIYAIGEKKVGSKKIEYMYVGRSEDMKRRLQQHKGPTPQQDIDQ
ncbi:unnamed protein product [Porites evermanni]|nr:unnamed protein product [Porites evermanni]